MKMKKNLMTVLIMGLGMANTVSANESAAVHSPLYNQYPHAIVCQGVTRGHTYELVYYLTNVSHSEFVIPIPINNWSAQSV